MPTSWRAGEENHQGQTPQCCWPPWAACENGCASSRHACSRPAAEGERGACPRTWHACIGQLEDWKVPGGVARTFRVGTAAPSPSPQLVSGLASDWIALARSRSLALFSLGFRLMCRKNVAVVQAAVDAAVVLRWSHFIHAHTTSAPARMWRATCGPRSVWAQLDMHIRSARQVRLAHGSVPSPSREVEMLRSCSGLHDSLPCESRRPTRVSAAAGRSDAGSHGPGVRIFSGHEAGVAGR